MIKSKHIYIHKEIFSRFSLYNLYIYQFVGVIILLTILCISACRQSPTFQDDIWASSNLSATVKTVFISPLTQSASTEVYTIANTIIETNRLMITELLLAMHQGKEQSEYIGTAHWFARKVLKINYLLLSGREIAFRVTLNTDFKVAGYRMLKDACINWDSASEEVASGHETSRELYSILDTLVAANSNEWVKSKVNEP